ncbi:hypothetical protein AB0D11_02170 [Streptomyces monashensis]|uniref:hypothetical protein n=1 Tax=Streptomyces monashensis TaxID=1678012 RepID=UPI0033FE934E
MFRLITRRRYLADLAAAKAESGRQRNRADQAERTARTEVVARRRTTEMYSDLYDEHERTVRENRSLCLQLEDARNTVTAETKARNAADRIARLQKAVAQARTEAAAARAGHQAVQRQLDDALGLNSAAVELGESWQARREQRMRYDKPTTQEATAS